MAAPHPGGPLAGEAPYVTTRRLASSSGLGQAKVTSGWLMSLTPATQYARADGECKLEQPVFANEPSVSTPMAVPIQRKHWSRTPARSVLHLPMNEISEDSAGGTSW